MAFDISGLIGVSFPTADTKSGVSSGRNDVRGVSLERDDVRLDPGDQVARKGEDVAIGERHDLPALEGGLAVADRNHGVALFDETVDGQRWAAGEIRVLDLPIERRFAFQVLEPGQIPDDVVGQDG